MLEQQYILASLIAFILGFTLLYKLYKKRTGPARGTGVKSSSESDVCRTDGPPDVVIVGAGVAGSALAYSLAKVCNKISCSVHLCYICMDHDHGTFHGSHVYESRNSTNCLLYSNNRMGGSCK